jgi:hypothetical protein
MVYSGDGHCRNSLRQNDIKRRSTKKWENIRTTPDKSDLIAHVAGIHKSLLLSRAHLSEFSIACRMSWAAKRQTTLLEDVAYCLLGTFDINMPLIYGKGRKAFRRLQEEIIKESDDQITFA